MQTVTRIPEHALSLDDLEAEMLDMPQVNCPVSHYFGPGVYIREIFVPAGTYIMGHAHKSPHTCVVVRGKMAVIAGGEARTVQGPMIFTAQAGRKFAYALEDTVFQNIFATEETDLDRLEDELIEKSPAWLERHLLAQHVEALREVA